MSGRWFDVLGDGYDPDFILDQTLGLLRPPGQQGRDAVPFGESLSDEDSPYGLFDLLALASAAFGVRSRAEIIFAVTSHFAFWLTGNIGIEGITSALSSVQLAKGRYATAALPTLKSALDTTRRLAGADKSPLVGWRAFMEQLIYVTGVLLVFFKVL